VIAGASRISQRSGWIDVSAATGFATAAANCKWTAGIESSPTAGQGNHVSGAVARRQSTWLFR
jgi:hypothetical protein